MTNTRFICFVLAVYFFFWIGKTTGANSDAVVHHFKSVTLQTRTIPNIAFCAGGRKLVMDDPWGKALLVWDTSTWEIAAKIVDQSGYPCAVASSPNGELIAVSKKVQDAKNQWPVEIYNAAKLTSAGIIEEANSVEWSLRFSADSRLLAFATWRPGHWLIRIWDVVKGKQVNSLVSERRDEGDDFFQGLAFSPDGSILATGTHEGKVHLWDLKARRIIRTFGQPRAPAHLGNVGFVIYSPDGKYLASGDSRSEPVVKIWDPVDGREIHQIQLSEDPIDQIQGLAFHPDGKYVAAASMQKMALFSVGNWNEIWARPKEDHERGFASVTFSPQGDLFAFISYPSVRTPGKSKELEVWRIGSPASR